MLEHNFKKQFGQNFISDKNLLDAIVADSGIDETSQVLEIGAGGGTLTEAIAKKAKKVVSYEIDHDLEDHLNSLNLENTKFIIGDVMKFSLEKIEEDFDDQYFMIANLPYYITTPIIFKFMGVSKKLKSLTIMVQKEVAERIVASPGSKDYGVLSVMCQYYGKPVLTRTVPASLFHPKPKVDSALVRIDIDKDKRDDGQKFYRFVQAAFAMRRKTLKNNLAHAGYLSPDKEGLLSAEILSSRSEVFSCDQLLEIFNRIKG